MRQSSQVLFLHNLSKRKQGQMTMPCMHIEMKLQHTGGFKLVLYLAFMVSERGEGGGFSTVVENDTGRLERN